jgi:hypothetical protein
MISAVRFKLVDDDDAFDHVGYDCGKWPVTQPHCNNSANAANPATNCAIKSYDARRATKTGNHQT